MAYLRIYEAELECDCGGYWTVYSHQLNDVHVCPQCGKTLEIYISVEVIEEACPMCDCPIDSDTGYCPNCHELVK